MATNDILDQAHDVAETATMQAEDIALRLVWAQMHRCEGALDSIVTALVDEARDRDRAVCLYSQYEQARNDYTWATEALIAARLVHRLPEHDLAIREAVWDGCMDPPIPTNLPGPYALK
jgi:hypothetical protein